MVRETMNDDARIKGQIQMHLASNSDRHAMECIGLKIQQTTLHFQILLHSQIPVQRAALECGHFEVEVVAARARRLH